MPLLRSLTWIIMYARNTFLEHLPMIIIVSGYTHTRNISVENNGRREWVPTYLCEKPRRYSLKESVTDLSNFIVIWDVIVIFVISTHTMFPWVSSNVPGYDSILKMMSDHTCNGNSCFNVRHWVTVDFLTPFLCLMKFGWTFSTRWLRPLLCMNSRRFM